MRYFPPPTGPHKGDAYISEEHIILEFDGESWHPMDIPKILAHLVSSLDLLWQRLDTIEDDALRHHRR